jgi:PAS domain S-box-containing protein
VLIEANRAALEFSGIKEPDVIGRPFWETPWWTHSVQLQEKLREAVGQAAAGKFVRFEATHLSKDKTLHYIDFSLKPVKDESGKVTFLIPEGRDITQMKIAQESLERSAAEWDRTFNSISDFIFIQDINHTIVRANAAFFKALGAEPKDILGKKCYQILHKTDFPWPDCPLEQTKIDLKSHTQEVDDPKIGVILLVSTSPVLNEEGELAGIVHIAKDISAQKKIEIELKKRVTDLERFQKVTVDRELRMKELKAKIAELEKRLAEL